MSVSPVLFNAEMFRQSQPWKSPWRVNLEKRMAAEGIRGDVPLRFSKPVAARGEGYVGPSSSPGVSAKPQSSGAGRGRPPLPESQRARRRRESQERPLCKCGAIPRGGETVCYRCRSNRNTPRRKCSNGCDVVLRITNKCGTCSNCRWKLAYAATHPPLPCCSFRDTIHRCGQTVTRANKGGLCGFHRPSVKGKYRTGTPVMVPHG